MKNRLVSKHRFVFCSIIFGLYWIFLPLLLFVFVNGIIYEKIYFAGALLISLYLTGAVLLLRDYLHTVTVFYRFSPEGIILSSPGTKKVFRWDELNFCGAITAAWDSRDAYCVYIYFSESYIYQTTLSSLSFDKIRKKEGLFWFLYNEEAFIELMDFIPPQWQQLLSNELEREKKNLGPFSAHRFKRYK